MWGDRFLSWGDSSLLCRDGCCFIRVGILHHGDGYNSSLFCLPASQTDEQDDEGQVLTHTSLPSARPLKTVKGYSLDDEDAAIYIVMLRMLIIFPPKREWPDPESLRKRLHNHKHHSLMKSLSPFHRCTTSIWTS